MARWPNAVNCERGCALTSKIQPVAMAMFDPLQTGVKNAVDQMVAVGGFDMLIFSFGSGFNLESDDPDYLTKVRDSVAYANQHGIEVCTVPTA